MKKLLTLTLSLLMAFLLCSTVNAYKERTYADDTVAVFLKRHNENTNAGDYDEIEYTKLQDAINAAKDGVTTTIVLVKDTTESITIPKNKSIMLVLQGHTLTAENNKDTIFIEKEGELCLQAMSRYDEQGELKPGRIVVTTSGYAAVFNNGSASLMYGGEYVRDGNSKWYIIVNHGTMDMYAGPKIESTNQYDTSSAIENGYVNYTSSNSREGYDENTNLANPVLTIDDGVSVSTYGSNAIKNDDGGVLIIEDGEFKTINKSDGAVIQNWNIATINGGTFTADNSLAVISNGAYDGVETNKGQLIINGGTFNASNVVFAYGVGASTPEYGVVKINNGTFIGEAAGSVSYKLDISGGTFSSDITKYLAEGYNAVKNNEGKYQVVKEDEDVIVPVDETKATTPALEEKAYDEAKTAVDALNEGKSEEQKITFDSSTKVELKAEEITSTTTDKYTKEDETKVTYVSTQAIAAITDVTNKEIKLMPLDITLNVINGDIETPITSLASEITVTLYLNDKTLSAIKDNTPTVVRIHDGEYEALETTLKGNALSFKTNKFSTYVIAYAVSSSDNVDSEPSTNTTTTTSTKTYDAKDKNKVGIISCEEEMNSANWIWSTTKNACVYKVSNTGVR